MATSGTPALLLPSFNCCSLGRLKVLFSSSDGVLKCSSAEKPLNSSSLSTKTVCLDWEAPPIMCSLSWSFCTFCKVQEMHINILWLDYWEGDDPVFTTMLQIPVKQRCISEKQRWKHVYILCSGVAVCSIVLPTFASACALRSMYFMSCVFISLSSSWLYLLASADLNSW